MRFTETRTTAAPDAAALAADIGRAIEGEVRFDDGSRALYATDASNYRQTPIGVVIPRSKKDVVETVAACRRAGAPLLSRGGGTSLAGQCCNVAVVLDMSKHYRSVLSLDAGRRIARVQPGLVLDELQKQAAPFGLRFGPDPATHTHCTLGGMIGNNSCGVHSLYAGRTIDNVVSMEVLTYDGEVFEVGETSEELFRTIVAAGGRRAAIYSSLRDLRDRYADLIRSRFPRLPRRGSGYNLDSLLPERGFDVARALVGAESTCVTVLEAAVRLVEKPRARVLLVLGYRDVFDAADHVPAILESKPIGLEAIDGKIFSNLMRKRRPVKKGLLPPGGGWLLVEFGARDREEADAQARALMRRLGVSSGAPSAKLYGDPEEEEAVWKIRESGLGATALVPGRDDTWEGWEDSAVPPDQLGGYLRDLKALYRKHGYDGALYGHFGQGCVHTRVNFDLKSAQGLRNFRAFLDDAADLVVRRGGSLSGEHGDGQSRAELLPKMYGTELVGAFREFKRIWDPLGRMNPGKMAEPAYRILDNLRLGVDYAPPEPPTHFHFPEDDGSFARATMRCVGIGECRRAEGGTMCPSYMVTREEKDSTRGRARLLFEMLDGSTLKRGWKDDVVREALDLCLSCKGCKGDCPVNVDMATYKAEFLSHYYSGRPRPRSAYAFGLIPWWAPVAARAPRLVNALTQSRIFQAPLKLAAGIARERRLPALAPATFVRRFRSTRRRAAAEAPVLLWPDTFNNHFVPETLDAAARSLERLGRTVILPRRPLCCGRPLYDYGMLDAAKRLLRGVLDGLRAEIRQGVPVVVLEPSCASVFRDELRGLFPHDEDARRLTSLTFTLGEWLAREEPERTFVPLRRPALVQGHCHHKAVLDFGSDLDALRRLGLELDVPESGCCGMAGGFGYEADHYAVSAACGERVILPKARSAPADALIVADGFSCREQIEQGSGRKPVHLAQVLDLSLGLEARG